MKLILLGTNGFLPTDKAQTASYLLPEPGILLDAGSGAYRLAQHLQGAPLDVYLSHIHGDHTSGLTYLFAAYFKKLVDASGEVLNSQNKDEFMRQANDYLHRTRIHGEPDTLEDVEEIYDRYCFQYVPLQEKEELQGGGVLTHFPLEHGAVSCVGYRLEWPGHSLAYVTDTISQPDASYIEKIQGVDLLLHECNNPNSSAELAKDIHHTYTNMVATVAAQAGVKRLILIHHSPFDFLDTHVDLEAARQIFTHTEIGFDGMECDF